MKQVVIIGLGMSADTLTAEGLYELQQADILLGAPRLIEQFADLGKPTCAEYTPEEVARVVNTHACERFCVLVSGDSGFYSATQKLCSHLKDYSLRVIPGVSSLSYFFARLKLPWQAAKLISCHGRESNLVDAVRRNSLTFALTGGNIAQMGQKLTQMGFGALNAHVGENLGAPEERILTMPVSQLADAGIGALAVLLIENPAPDARVRCGIADSEFIRGEVPMTKAEVRAVTMSKLALSPQAVCCDIGTGTGSLAVEMALAAYEGQVYALDHSEEAIQLVTANCRAFQIGNVEPILGSAPAALVPLPPLDAAFIGGSSGKLPELFQILLHSNPKIRLVVNAVTLETLHTAMDAFSTHGISPEIVQINVSHAKPAGNLHMLHANSPVFILSGGGNE